MKYNFADHSHDSILTNRHFKDLNPILFGVQKCRSGHSYGPESRNYVLIHFVMSGCGTFTIRGETYTVNAGEAFIATPNEIIEYHADLDDPWYYMWIGFDGELSKSFYSLPAVVKYRTNWAAEILTLDRESTMLSFDIASKLFLMYSEWFSENKGKNDYVKSVKDYVDAKYTQQISVEGIADSLSLDRRYLSRLFKQRTGMTIQEYIIMVRIEKAKQLLSEGYNISETVQRCGYDDICNFSKMFKKHTSISPGKWKEQQD